MRNIDDPLGRTDRLVFPERIIGVWAQFYGRQIGGCLWYELEL